MNEEQKPPPSAEPTGRLTFTEADGPVHRTVISAFMQSYNQFYYLTRTSKLDVILADLTMRARALRQIGEVDDTFLAAFEDMVRNVDASMTHLGRGAAATLDFMVKKRGGAGQAVEEWPESISDEEM